MANTLQKNWKKFTAYLVIISHSLTTCVWAGLTPLQTLPEYYVAPRIEQLTPSIGYVVPGVIDETGAHAFFDQLTVQNRTGLVFDTPAPDLPIYVRVQGERPTVLSSATLATSQYDPLFLSNPHGLQLHNANFKNIRNLNLMAGELFQTQQGMVASVQDSFIQLDNTTIAPDEAMKSLLLSAERIHINQSQLHVADAIHLKTGSYLYAISSGKTEKIDQTEEDKEQPSLAKHAVITSPETSLLSKRIVIESLNEGENILLNGLLYSTYGDITIRAQGDVILHEFLSTANLTIETTGRVIFEEYGLVGGNLHIQAQNILLKNNISVRGKSYLKSRSLLENLRTITCEEEAIFEAETLTNRGHVLSGRDIFIETLKDVKNHGHFGTRGQWNLKTENFTNEGDIEAYGGIKGFVQKETINKGSLRTQQDFSFKSHIFKNNLGAKIFSLGLHQLQTNLYEDAGSIYSPFLSVIQADSIDYQEGYQFHGNEAFIQATENIKAAADSEFAAGTYLHFYSGGNIDHKGYVNVALETSFPYEAYFNKGEGLPKAYATNFVQKLRGRETRAEVQHIRTSLPPKRGTGTLVFEAAGSLSKCGEILASSGSIFYKARDLRTKDFSSRAGIFEGNNTLVDAVTALMESTKFSTPAGAYRLIVKEGFLKDLDIDAATYARVFGENVSMHESRVWSADSSVESQSLRMIGSAVGSTKGVSVIHTKVGQLRDVKTYGAQGASLEGTESLTIEGLTSRAPVTAVKANHLDLSGVTASGHVDIEAQNLTLGGILNGTSVRAKGEHVDNKSCIKANEGTATVEATESYVDTTETRIEGTDRAELLAPKNSSFDGVLEAHTVAVHVKDMDLLDLLNHIQACAAEVHLEAPVVLDKDYVFKQTLSLWTESLTMKANITANRDFMVEAQRDILNTGIFLGAGEGHFLAGGSFVNRSGEISLNGTLAVRAKSISNEGRREASARLRGRHMFLKSTEGDISSHHGYLDAGEDMVLDSAKDLKFKATKAKAGKRMQVAAAREVELETLTRRMETSDGYRDETEETSLGAGESLRIEAGQDLVMVGIKTYPGEGGTLLKAGCHIIDRTLALGSKSSTSGAEGSRHEEKVSRGVSEHISTGDVATQAGGRAIFYGTKFRGRDIQIFGKAGVSLEEVHDELRWSSHSKKEGGLFEKTTEESSSGASLESHGLQFVAEGTVSIKSDGSIDLTHANFQAPKTVLEAPIVKILLGTNYSESTFTKKSSDLAWESFEQRVEQHKIRMAGGFSGSLIVNARETIVEEIRGKTLDYITRIEGNPRSISKLLVEEFHDVKEIKKEGPSKALTAVIAIAVTIATQGAGAGLLGISAGAGATTLSVIGAGMANTAFTSICSQAALALVSNKGDIVKAAESLVQEDALTSLGMSILTAGVTLGASDALGVSITEGTMGTLERSAISNTVGVGAQVLQGRDLGGAAIGGLVKIATSTIDALASGEIGTLYKDHVIGPVTHKLMHTALGGALGAIQGEGNPLKAALAGATGALVATTTADMLRSDAHTMATHVLERATREGVPPTEENLGVFLREDIQKIVNISTATTALVSFFTGQNVEVSVGVATAALQNNCSKMIEEMALEEIRDLRSEEVSRTSEVFSSKDAELAPLGSLEAERQAGNMLRRAKAQEERFRFLETMDAPVTQVDDPFTGAFGGTGFICSLGSFAKSLVLDAAGDGISSFCQKHHLLSEERCTQLGEVIKLAPDAWHLISSGKSKIYESSTLRRSRSLEDIRLKPEGPLMAPERLLPRPEDVPYSTPYSRGFQHSFVTEKDETYYRVYSGRDKGNFLTKVPPKNRAFAIEGLALPPGNSAQYIQEVSVPAGTRLQRSRARSVGQGTTIERRGGLEQFEIRGGWEKTGVKFGEGKPFH